MVKSRIAARSRLSMALVLCGLLSGISRADDRWISLPGGDGPGKGKHVVLISGDEEYRSEEALPQLAKILAKRHGFNCTVLFAIGPDGTIDPDRRDNIPGLEALEDGRLAGPLHPVPRPARRPDEAGRRLRRVGPADHRHADGDARLRRQGGEGLLPVRLEQQGVGRRVRPERAGGDLDQPPRRHGKQSTRGVIAEGAEEHPIVRGIEDGDIWGPTDVYGVRLPLPGDSKPLVLGQVLEGMKPTDRPVEGKVNDPMMPIAWMKSYTGAKGKAARVFTTTMGASQDLASEGLRRLLVNACYWAVGPGGRDPRQGRRRARRRVPPPAVRLRDVRQGGPARRPGIK